MPPAEVDRDAVARAVWETIASILPAVPADAIRGTVHLKDLGADSVDRVEIILALLDRFDLREPMSSFNRLPSIDALVDFLCETGQR